MASMAGQLNHSRRYCMDLFQVTQAFVDIPHFTLVAQLVVVEIQHIYLSEICSNFICRLYVLIRACGSNLRAAGGIVHIATELLLIENRLISIKRTKVMCYAAIIR